MKKYKCLFCRKISTAEEINKSTAYSIEADDISDITKINSSSKNKANFMCPKCNSFQNGEGFIEVKEEKELKTYKTWEVMKMLTENPKLKFKKQGWDNTRLTIIDDKLGFVSLTGYWEEERQKESKFDVIDWLYINDEWILVKDPVTFEEVLNSDKKCRVEHDLFNDNYYLGDLKDILKELSADFNKIEFKKIIKNGKWYLED